MVYTVRPSVCHMNKDGQFLSDLHSGTHHDGAAAAAASSVPKIKKETKLAVLTTRYVLYTMEESKKILCSGNAVT